MQDKQKSTLYLPPELHRKLKIRAAVETQPMSVIAERAIHFYLSHPEVVDQVEEEQGHVHQVYICPECSTSTVIRDGNLVSLRDQPGVLLDDELPSASFVGASSEDSSDVGDAESDLDRQLLVPC